jgi:23S rRNA pseudouridine2605 synthase
MSDLQAKPIRLHAFLAAAGIASRRACEELIKQGRVEVDGQPASIGQKVYGTEDIRVNGQPIPVLSQKRFRYILLNKPKGYLSSIKDPQGRPCAIDLIAPSIPDRLYNIGRLDQWSSGLLLFTNDGNFAAQLMHPSSEIDKEYFVQTDQPIPPGFAASFMRGIIQEGVRYRAHAVRVVAPDKAHIVLIEGKNREIRRVLEHFGLRAKILERIRIGPLSIGELSPGQWRDLTEEEIYALKAYMSSRPSNKGLQK